MSSSYSQMRPLTGAGPAPGHTANSMSTSEAQGSGANTMRRRKYSSISLMRGSLSTSENKDNFLVYLRRRGASALSLLAGVLIGLIIASALMGVSSGRSSWHPSGGSLSTNWNPRTKQTSLPTLEQRERIIKVLGTLTGRHTRFCLRKAQKAYRRQVYERYEPIVGYQRKNSRRGVLSRLVPNLLKKRGLFSHSDHEETEINKIFHSDSRNGGKGMSQGHKYYFAINLYNSFDIIPDLFSNMFRVSAILGYNNVFISVYENGSSDQTKALLRVFDALCRSVGLRVMIRSSQRRRGAFAHRIEYLAEVRNAALVPLQELRDATGEVFDSIIFMNDVLPCVDDLLELIWQSRRQNAGITCGSDYIFHDEVGAPVFYDNWVARDINGTALENAPFENVFHDTESTHRFQRHLPIQVQSCWNGIAILDPAPMYAHPHVRFRMANLPKGECSASECSLICNDYWEAGYGRIIMIPRVKLAYEGVSWLVLSYCVFHLIHPERRNLTTIRGYTRLGGNADDPHSDPQDRSWHGPHDRLFRQEESEAIVFKQPPPYVWCWGWDGPGDLAGPDVEPIWEKMPNLTFDPVTVRHDRSFVELG
ncbi:BZ3500_MvSof-1268-A1-R1_Chr2-1g04391 [Microbotryum saponariae]|uniref:BZ3500_MvSof-1268-A1-R1_Chr2-1g04391 protein n=1 Tax=Microbotryum saponariae TaxID=289078 RepID=A0A2X0MIV9_9BASI|nr:BZ3500_MvSof-1268-A1-R1_Chr2-1g04391 [Microbotryum saponariae]SCZ91605.1 BZ3501_MvSof-1269-A2-R1_Chr2-1g04047 [Microbotryum saponariae]